MDDNKFLVFKNINKSISGKEILRDIGFHVNKGEVFGYIGPNGAGKTTSIKIILGILSANFGSVQFQGQDVSKLTYEEKKRIACVLDRDGLQSLLTCYENLEYYARIYDVPNYKGKIDFWFEKLNLQDRAKDMVKTLSKGLKQKVALARAFVVSPELLILDEPFSHLDPSSQIEVRDIIKELSVKSGKTVFVSSHNLDHLEKISDSLAFIHKGEIKLFDNMDSLRKSFKGQGVSVQAEIGELTRFAQIIKDDRGIRNQGIVISGNTLLLEGDGGDMLIYLANLIVRHKINIDNMGKKKMSLESVYSKVIND